MQIAEESVNLWQLDQLDNLELLSASFVHQSFPRHSHSTYSVALIEEGIELLQFGTQLIYAQMGQIILINPDEPHANKPGDERGWCYRNFYLTRDHFYVAGNRLGIPLLQPPHFAQRIINNPLLFDRLRRIHQQLEMQGPTVVNEQDLFTCLGELVLRYAQLKPIANPLAFSPGLLEVVETINQEPAQPMSIDQMARQAGLSRFHFIRRFSQLTGLPPMAYTIQKRIELAKTLLRQQMPIAQVALETGFFDQSHFTHSFKRLTGTTPGDLR
ncbi:AraC family transcriptional regulator [Spirosoma migulaei]